MNNTARNNMFYQWVLLLCCAAGMPAAFVACSDEPDTDNLYVFETTMMNEYLTTRPQYSDFATIVSRAGLMDLLSSYGSYTCFAPDNDAVAEYLQHRGMHSVDDLTKADCDTIARTHLLSTMLSTGDMTDGVLAAPNMNRRYLEVSHGHDENDNPVVVLNDDAHIIFALRDDSLENGIVQPVNKVLESSNRMIVDILKLDPNVSLFYEALKATRLADSLYAYKDEAYDGSAHDVYAYTSDGHVEKGFAPAERLIGFTILAEPDSILKAKYGITTLHGLYEEACRRYDPLYGETDQPWHAFDQLTDRRNPLNRYVAYHILNRNVIDKSRLTPWCPLYSDVSKRDIGIEITLINPEDWHHTLLPHTMVNAQRLTKVQYRGPGKYGEHYINRRCDADYAIPGAMVSKPAAKNAALNGVYFYLDDIIAFDRQTSELVQNVRIRMDIATLFPELITNDIRLNGDPTYGGEDETGVRGRNYYFPEGYLDGGEGNGYLIYRRPHTGYSCYQGDEMNMMGDYDITFRLPPVPSRTSETYQIRLGFTRTSTRGICQIYYDGKPQGIPLDMTKSLKDVYPQLVDAYSSLTREEKIEDRKVLKNLGYYRGPGSAFRTGSSAYYYDQTSIYRLVICTVSIDPNEDHYLRFRNVSNNGSDELMLDYIELVPKSVYGVNESDGTPEDDL